MTTLNRKVGEMAYDNLIAGITPPVHVSSGVIRKLAAETTLARGTVLAKSNVDNKLVILGTAKAEAADAIAPTYTLTADVAITAGKTYYTKVGDVYTAVASPVVGDIGTYYEMTDPGSPAVEAEVLTTDCILCDDVVVGTVADVNVAVYTAGCFNINALTVKESYAMTEADKDNLRERGIYLGTIFE